MSNSTGISELYREFTDALTEVLAENAIGPAHCGSSRGSPLSRKHPDYGESGYLAAVERPAVLCTGPDRAAGNVRRAVFRCEPIKGAGRFR